MSIKKWLCKVLGCECDCKCEPREIDLVEGMNVAVYRGTVESAEVVFKELIDAKVLEVVRWQDSSNGNIKELFYTTYGTPGWVNDIGDVMPGEAYYIKVKAPFSGLMF